MVIHLITIVEYLILAILTVFLSIHLSQCVDIMDKKSNLSGAFIGGVLLAAVTSLPELFTSLTAVLALDKPQLIQGNVLGSNIFNLTIYALTVLFFTKSYREAKIAKTQRSSLFFCIIMFLCVIFALFYQIEINFGFTQLHLMSLVILVIYLISTILIKGDNSVDNEDSDATMTLRQASIRFVIFAVLLVIVSILLTQVTDQLSAQLNLGATVAGAIFLGVATSLPELSSSLSLAKLKNFNASVANVVGSCVFNFTILSFADLIYSKGGIYGYYKQALIFSIFGILSCILTVMGLHQKWSKNGLRMIACGILVCYVASVVLSM